MVAKLIGISDVNFLTPNGDRIEGNNIFVSYADPNVVGEKTEKFFVKKDIAFPENLKIGESINLSFNQRGKIEAIIKK